jgi:hypothetical protein
MDRKTIGYRRLREKIFYEALHSEGAYVALGQYLRAFELQLSYSPSTIDTGFKLQHPRPEAGNMGRIEPIWPEKWPPEANFFFKGQIQTL